MPPRLLAANRGQYVIHREGNNGSGPPEQVRPTGTPANKVPTISTSGSFVIVNTGPPLSPAPASASTSIAHRIEYPGGGLSIFTVRHPSTTSPPVHPVDLPTFSTISPSGANRRFRLRNSPSVAFCWICGCCEGLRSAYPWPPESALQAVDCAGPASRCQAHPPIAAQRRRFPHRRARWRRGTDGGARPLRPPLPRPGPAAGGSRR